MTGDPRPARAILVPACDRPAQADTVRTLAAATRVAGRHRVAIASGSGVEIASGSCAGEVLGGLIELVRRDGNGAILVIPVGADHRDDLLAQLVAAACDERDRIHVPATSEDGDVVPFAGTVTAMLLAFHHAHPELLRSELHRTRYRRRSAARVPRDLCVHRDVLARAHPGLVQRLPELVVRRPA